MIKCPYMGTPSQSINTLNITYALTACRNLREFDQRLTHALQQAVDCDFVGLYLYSQSTQTFAPVSAPLTDPDCPGYMIGQLPADGTMKETAVRQGRALLEHNLRDSPWTEAVALKTSPFTTGSVLVAPLVEPVSTGMQPARTVAVISVVAAGRTGAFTDDDRLFLEQLGIQLGPVLQNILASEERDALMAINRQVVVETMTTEQLMPVVRDMLHRVVRQDMTGMVRFVQSPNGPWFDIVYRDGVEIDLAQLRQFPFDQMAPAEMLATGKPLLITGHNHTHFPERAYIESVGILSCILCPLIVRGTPYGFLAIGSRRRNAFSDRDLGFSEQIGFHLSQAMTNLTAYEEIRTLKEQLEQENVYLRDEINATVDFKTLVGESAALQKTLKLVEQVAPTDSTVLITGETGTGKELLAQAIHRLSPRKEKPLITLNCAALPPTLIESELFGHEKGAFTNATARKIGRFEVADGGTIFLDEVGELPIDLQAKFLRVLEAQELQRVGGTQTIRVNVRVLAATNVDVEQAVKNGRFRSDLFYRLNVFPVRVPPLRERRDDIPSLARHFVKKYSERHRRPITRIGSGTLKALTSYDWPGNVRELEHVIERAVIVSRGPVLVIDELTQPDEGMIKDTAPRTLADAERVHIVETLRQTKGVLAGKHGAAARLGMKRSTLQHRMKKLGIRQASAHSP
ncbi:MAG: GAF domain-containing protein [Nitrospira sp.]|nr:GAF domain-containing protein [Nitrospira sp.]